jgi:hypothetical protein
MVDDATGITLSRMAEGETTRVVFEALSVICLPKPPELPPKDIFEKRLHDAIERAREKELLNKLSE